MRVRSKADFAESKKKIWMRKIREFVRFDGGLVDAEGFLVNGTFGRGFDAVKAHDKAEPSLQGTVSEADFQVAHGDSSFESSQDGDAEFVASSEGEGVERLWGYILVIFFLARTRVIADEACSMMRQGIA